MTVEQLIVELKKCDPQAEVITEGCDCDGDSAYLQRDPYQDGSAVVYIRRFFKNTNNRDEKYDNKTIWKPLSEIPSPSATSCCSASEGEQTATCGAK